MNAKQAIPIPLIIVVIVAALAIIGFLGFKAMAGPVREAPSSQEMYGTVAKMAKKSGGDYSKLTPDDQKFLDLMSHGHGQKLLENEYARTNASGGK